MLHAPCCAAPQGGKKGGAVGGQAEEPSDIFKIVKMIVDRNFDPVIVFSFSKRECEVLAAQVGGCLVSVWKVVWVWEGGVC